jgi:hypothetical protein
MRSSTLFPPSARGVPSNLKIADTASSELYAKNAPRRRPDRSIQLCSIGYSRGRPAHTAILGKREALKPSSGPDDSRRDAEAARLFCAMGHQIIRDLSKTLGGWMF